MVTISITITYEGEKMMGQGQGEWYESSGGIAKDKVYPAYPPELHAIRLPFLY